MSKSRSQRFHLGESWSLSRFHGLNLCISSSMEKTPQEISRRAVNPKSWLVNIGSFFLFFLSDVAVRNQDEEDTAIRPRERDIWWPGRRRGKAIMIRDNRSMRWNRSWHRIDSASDRQPMIGPRERYVQSLHQLVPRCRFPFHRFESRDTSITLISSSWPLISGK